MSKRNMRQLTNCAVSGLFWRIYKVVQVACDIPFPLYVDMLTCIKTTMLLHKPKHPVIEGEGLVTTMQYTSVLLQVTSVKQLLFNNPVSMVHAAN